MDMNNLVKNKVYEFEFIKYSGLEDSTHFKNLGYRFDAIKSIHFTFDRIEKANLQGKDRLRKALSFSYTQEIIGVLIDFYKKTYETVIPP
jgi:hypothetical protein